ncbi:MAG: SAM hydrolase/SAM-dependent halogenase family protein [Gemmatimonadaceae bacterium]
MRPVITLLTDFGTADGYVAEMKGVLYSLAPEARVVDLAHDIPPQDVESARLAVARYWRRFPPQTIHVVVVDPGVGSNRAALAVRSEDRVLIGPDNGVLSPALLVAGARAVSLTMSSTASPTFHGRDVFAPVAARVAMGTPIDALGTDAESPIIRRTPEARRLESGAIQGEVISIDRYGNAITNIVAFPATQTRDGDPALVEIGGRTIPIARTYADVHRNAAIALAGSSGLLEIAVRDGNAAALLGLSRGSVVTLHNAPSR